MKEYIYKEKTVSINKIKYKVILPEKHSNIDGLIYEVTNLNADDDYANIPYWHTLCMILKKGYKKWETLHNGSSRSFEINNENIGTCGIFNLLFQLENEKTRNDIIKKAEIKELKDRIKKDTKRLQLLKKETKVTLKCEKCGKNLGHKEGTHKFWLCDNCYKDFLKVK